MKQVDEALLGEATKDDMALREQVRTLAWTLLDQAYEILEHGRPQDRISLISRLVPPMMRALGEEDQSGRGVEQLRTDLREMFAEVKSGVDHTDGQATVDPG